MSDALTQWMLLAYQLAANGESAATPEERAMCDQWREIFDAQQITPASVMAEFERQHLPGYIAAATEPRPGKKTASTRAAQELCHAAAYCIENDIAMPRQLKEYILNGLRAGIKGESVDAALRLKRGAGQAKDDDPLFVMANERRVAVRIYGMTTREGLTVAQAKERACKEFDIDTRRAEQIWQKYRPAPHAEAAWGAYCARFFELFNSMPSPARGEAYEAWRQEIQAHIRLDRTSEMK